MTKAFISEILAMEAHGRIPEVTKKPEIFQFFSIFDLKRENFSNFFTPFFFTFYCASSAIKIIQIGWVVWKIRKMTRKTP